MTAMRGGARGSALVLVLALLVVCELGLLLAALQVHRAASGYLYEHQRLEADRLSESGIAHAEALLFADSGFLGRVEGRLRAGRYAVAIEGGAMPGEIRIESTGYAGGRHAVRLVVTLVRQERRLRRGSRERTHFVTAGGS